jgi:hypothetical protein
MHQQLWGYKVEDKLYLGVREQKRLNTAGLRHCPAVSMYNKILSYFLDQHNAINDTLHAGHDCGMLYRSDI